MEKYRENVSCSRNHASLWHLDNFYMGSDIMGRLILGMLGYIIIYLSGMYFFVMNDYEKDVVRKPVQKVLRKIGIQK